MELNGALELARRWYSTLSPLRWEQWLYRIRLNSARLRVIPSMQMRGIGTLSLPGDFPEPSMLGENVFQFLGERHIIDTGCWEHSNAPLLWNYNLHYFDDLNAAGADARTGWHVQLIQRWVDAHLGAQHIGLAPYPTSLRIINWIRWMSRHPDLVRDEWLASLQAQIDLLTRRIEYHLLGNHLFENGRALVFSGAYHAGPQAERWLDQGLSILERELPEQFLADGGHFERSPMYQGTMMWGLLDLIELAAHGPECLKQPAVSWRKVFIQGMAWLQNMSFPDGEIAFFNDACFGIAPTVAQLTRRAGSLGIMMRDPDQTPALYDLSTSGYVRVRASGLDLVADLAPLGPEYQPGHAHADTLSCELAIRGQRLLVNSGISCYGTGAERQWQRSTAAHNTVCIDGRDSSDVWAGFRVGVRARVFDRVIETPTDQFRFAASHNGYRYRPGRPVHRRSWLVTGTALTITDTISGRFQSAQASFLLHPEWSVSLDGMCVHCIHPLAGEVVLLAKDVRLRIEQAQWHPRFSASFSTRRLVAEQLGPRAEYQIKW